MSRIVLSRRAERDLRRVGRGEALARLREALEGLAVGEAGLDVKPLAGSAPWHRLRVGDYRVLYRAVEPDEAGDQMRVSSWPASFTDAISSGLWPRLGE